MDEKIARLEHELAHLKRRRKLLKAAELDKHRSEASRKKAEIEKRRREKIKTLPALEKKLDALRRQLCDMKLFEDAVPGPGMPVRREPVGLVGSARLAFRKKALDQYQSAMLKWIEPEIERLRSIVNDLSF
jgi:hypothetical protein